MLHKSRLFLIGAGPGAINLITKRALGVLKKADIIISGRSVNPNLLFYGNKNAQYISACSDDSVVYEELTRLKERKLIAWLTIGDPIFFSKHNRRMKKFSKIKNLEIEIIPGVTSAIAAPTYSGILISKPDCTDTVTIAIGKKIAGGKASCPKKSDSPTVIFFLALDCLRELTEKMLKAGWQKDDSIALIENGTTGNRAIFGKLSEIADLADKNKISEPALFVCGNETSSANRFGWFEKKPLFAKRIVVTRPMPEGLKTVDKLEELGADPLYIPVVRIETIPNRIDSTEFDIIIFTSARSVSCFFDNIDNSDIIFSRNTKIACVGRKTASALKQYHIKSDIVPDDFSSKALTDKLIDKGVSNKKILIPGSIMMNSKTKSRLEAAGAKVKSVYLYKPEKNKILWEDLLRRKIEKWKNIDYLMLTSGFIAKMAAEFFDDEPLLIKKSLKVVAISKNVGKIAENLGFKNIMISEEATEDAMIKKIIGDVR